MDNVVEPVEQWRGMQAAVERLGLQPVGDLTKLGRGKPTPRLVSLFEVRPPDAQVPIFTYQGCEQRIPGR